MWTGTPPRLKTFDYLGLHRYFLTFCTYQRRPVFVTPDRVDVVRTQILRTLREQKFALIVCCYMPDHLHLLVEARADDCDGRRFIALAKQLTGYHYKQRFGERLWQRYGYERTLRSDEATLSVARYIVENPVRAKLVTRLKDYPFIGSGLYSIDEILEAIQLPDDWLKRSR
jgi:REP element-mobilizing transposase RayT